MKLSFCNNDSLSSAKGECGSSIQGTGTGNDLLAAFFLDKMKPKRMKIKMIDNKQKIIAPAMTKP